MDLIQRKLTKSEWEGIEIPVSSDELEILKLIKSGYKNVNIKYNNSLSLINYMKIDVSENTHIYLYERYMQTIVTKLCTKYKINYKEDSNKSKHKHKPKKCDIIRINNIDSSANLPYIGNTKNKIFEYTILEIIDLMFKHKTSKYPTSTKWVFYYYTLIQLSDLNIYNYNTYVKIFTEYIISQYKTCIDLKTIIKHSQDIIEKNSYLIKYANTSLYTHQKKLFSLYRTSNKPKLTLYIAPTATGKTLSPIGLAEKHKIIFVCAARHVGLSLAKSAISAGRKIALAFDCNDSEDVRLHYSAAKETIRDKRSGAIKKVDNTVGDLVEIIICDIKSFQPAMYYMLAFNDKDNCIVYWDEPTITMDYSEHPFHEIIKSNWINNIIPNIILSSATLPKEHEIHTVMNDYIGRFGGTIDTISSHECKKSIQIINKKGEIYLPHYMCSDYKQVLQSVLHIESYPTLLRYMDLNQIINFILYVNNNNLINDVYSIDNYFSNILEVNMTSVKEYYLLLIKHISDWDTVYKYFNTTDNKDIPFNSNIHMVTHDAYTLTDGPTIYLADNVDKIAKYCIQEANIPNEVMRDIMIDIAYNNNLNIEINKLSKLFEDGIAKDVDKEKKLTQLRLSPELKQLKNKIDELTSTIKVIKLHDMFIPNRLLHLNKYRPDITDINLNHFTCDISESIIIRLMQLTDVDDKWKVLLLMGIGVFTNHESITYTEIMKELAENQKLFMIIASSDYIYGTNYQFCQGYIGKDLCNMTQEKAIQAMGRIGRSNIQQTYSIRFRDDSLLEKIFMPHIHKPEVENMNKLLCS